LRISAEGYRDHSDVRVIGIAYVINTDSDEDIELTVGRPSQSLGDYLTQADRDADALVRRGQAQSKLDTTPIGTLLDYAGDPAQPAPPLFLWANGAPYDATLYPDLFAVTGYRYGGSGNAPLLPDTRGRVMLGAGQGAGLANRPVGSVGGAETVQITPTTMPAHIHGNPTHTHVGGQHAHNAPQHNHALPLSSGLTATGILLVGGGSIDVMANPYINQPTGMGGGGATDMGGGVNTGAGGGLDTASNGGNVAHENMPPFMALPKIIRAAR
jgi:microcystin-dependent protein